MKIIVDDDGIGMAGKKKSVDKGGIGIDSMNDRAHELGGKLQIDKTGTTGTTIMVVLPINSVLMEEKDEEA